MTKRPTAGLYESSYFSNDNTPGYGDYESEFPAHYESFRSRITKSEFKLGRKGRLLDIGCALGHCGKAAQDLGWETYVTDASTFAVNHAAEKHDLKSFVTSGDHIPVKTDAFDCVTLFDVIEHVNDPKLLLTEIARTLNKDGMLHLSTPNVSSMSAKLMGRHWYHYKPGEHLLYFSPATLQRTLEESGFDVLAIEALPISMRLGDIILRLKKYWTFGFSILHTLTRKLRLNDRIFVIYAGEMQAWAKPKASLGKSTLAASEDVFETTMNRQRAV